VHNLQSGKGITSVHNTKSALTPGLQVPGLFADDAEEAGGVWAIADGIPELLEDFEGLKQAFAAETTNTEALKPRTLAEARHRPEWLLWEHAIEEELATLKAMGTW
jgi:hypothetical protein